MGYPTRIYYTETDKALMWDRWQKGESLNEIGRHFGRSHTSIQNILSRTGGIRPPARKVPPFLYTGPGPCRRIYPRICPQASAT